MISCQGDPGKEMATKSQDLITHFLGQNLKILQINKKLMGTVKRNTYEMEFANSFRKTPYPKAFGSLTTLSFSRHEERSDSRS